jgi:hypothetical protein
MFKMDSEYSLPFHEPPRYPGTPYWETLDLIYSISAKEEMEEIGRLFKCIHRIPGLM